jgi:hypothetical protein
MSRAVSFRIGEEKSEIPTIYIGRHTITTPAKWMRGGPLEDSFFRSCDMRAV